MSQVINVRIWEPVPQHVRINRYEVPLTSVLRAYHLGDIISTDVTFNRELEVEFAELEVEIDNLDEGINTVKRVLEQAGAPAGSEMRLSSDGKETVIPFGKKEGLAIYLDGVNLPDDVYETCNLNELAGLIAGGLASTGAEIRGSWVGRNETSLYIYSPCAETTYETIEPVLSAYPLCQSSRIVIRHGNPNLNPRTVRLPLHEKDEAARIYFYGKTAGSG
ncbi:MAG TPA: hypothetical protein VFG19_11255 [Geobacteraceae bacterium]|nr:hypothetical protein [Geobacteraceae bacterium]